MGVKPVGIGRVARFGEEERRRGGEEERRHNLRRF